VGDSREVRIRPSRTRHGNGFGQHASSGSPAVSSAVRSASRRRLRHLGQMCVQGSEDESTSVGRSRCFIGRGTCYRTEPIKSIRADTRITSTVQFGAPRHGRTSCATNELQQCKRQLGREGRTLIAALTWPDVGCTSGARRGRIGRTGLYRPALLPQALCTLRLLPFPQPAGTASGADYVVPEPPAPIPAAPAMYSRARRCRSHRYPRGPISRAGRSRHVPRQGASSTVSEAAARARARPIERMAVPQALPAPRPSTTGESPRSSRHPVLARAKLHSTSAWRSELERSANRLAGGRFRSPLRGHRGSRSEARC